MDTIRQRISEVIETSSEQKAATTNWSQPITARLPTEMTSILRTASAEISVDPSTLGRMIISLYLRRVRRDGDTAVSSALHELEQMWPTPARDRSTKLTPHTIRLSREHKTEYENSGKQLNMSTITRILLLSFGERLKAGVTVFQALHELEQIWGLGRK